MRVLRRTSRWGPFKMEFTPMIDVVFLLLVFFLCTLKFKTLEGKLATYLPKDRGPQRHWELPVPREDIRLKLSARGGQCVCAVMGRPVGALPEDRGRIYEHIRRLRRAMPESPAIIDADPAVAHGHVVTLVDECIRARIDEITFAAALPALARKG
ncbi:MAG: biopolymer transporter ExbD [Planctomycetes bacterium]|nr:biopolymer transporter ExbD [Planctomycetota bacterium]